MDAEEIGHRCLQVQMEKWAKASVSADGIDSLLELEGLVKSVRGSWRVWSTVSAGTDGIVQEYLLEMEELVKTVYGSWQAWSKMSVGVGRTGHKRLWISRLSRVEYEKKKNTSRHKHV